MKKYISIIILNILSFSLFAQSGLYNGLNVKFDYQKSIDNRINQLQLDLQNRQLQTYQLQNLQNQLAAIKAEKKEKAQACAQQTKNYYSDFKKYPEFISDGWYNVIVTNNYDFCDLRKVYVEQNRVKKYFIDNYIERRVAFSSPISNAKAHVRLIVNGNESDLNDVYFIDNIIDPNASASKPRMGKYTFYTTYKKAGTIRIYLEGDYVGSLSQYFDPKIGTPYCGQESSGTVTFVYKPGTYNYVAQGNSAKWSGQITIYDDDCRSINLTR